MKKSKGFFLKYLPDILIVILAACLIFTIFSAMMDTNNQGEFRDYETGTYHWDAILPILGFWMTPFIVLEILAIMSRLATSRILRKNETPVA